MADDLTRAALEQQLIQNGANLVMQQAQTQAATTWELLATVNGQPVSVPQGLQAGQAASWSLVDNPQAGFGLGGTPGQWIAVAGNLAPSQLGLGAQVLGWDGSKAQIIQPAVLNQIFGPNWASNLPAPAVAPPAATYLAPFLGDLGALFLNQGGRGRGQGRGRGPGQGPPLQPGQPQLPTAPNASTQTDWQTFYNQGYAAGQTAGAAGGAGTPPAGANSGELQCWQAGFWDGQNKVVPPRTVPLAIAVVNPPPLLPPPGGGGAQTPPAPYPDGTPVGSKDPQDVGPDGNPILYIVAGGQRQQIPDPVTAIAAIGLPWQSGITWLSDAQLQAIPAGGTYQYTASSKLGIDQQTQATLGQYPDLVALAPVICASIRTFQAMLQEYTFVNQTDQTTGGPLITMINNDAAAQGTPRGGIPSWAAPLITGTAAFVGAVLSCIPFVGTALAAALNATAQVLTQDINQTNAQAAKTMQTWQSQGGGADSTFYFPYSYRGFSDFGFIPMYAATQQFDFDNWQTDQIAANVPGYGGQYLWKANPKWGQPAMTAPNQALVQINGKPYAHRAVFQAYIDDLLNRVAAKLTSQGVNPQYLMCCFPRWAATAALPFAARGSESATAPPQTPPVPASFDPAVFELWLDPNSSYSDNYAQIMMAKADGSENDRTGGYGIGEGDGFGGYWWPGAPQPNI